jgi:transcriptional regulator with XRE-family HTH domain
VVDEDTQTLLRAIGANVTRLRKSRGMTQAQLAEAIDVETNFLQKIEYGTGVPSLSTVARLARVLRVPAAALFRAGRARSARAGRPRAKKKSAARA